MIFFFITFILLAKLNWCFFPIILYHFFIFDDWYLHIKNKKKYCVYIKAIILFIYKYICPTFWPCPLHQYVVEFWRQNYQIAYFKLYHYFLFCRMENPYVGRPIITYRDLDAPRDFDEFWSIFILMKYRMIFVKAKINKVVFFVFTMGMGTYNYTFKSVVFESVKVKSVKIKIKILSSLRMVQKIICEKIWKLHL